MENGATAKGHPAPATTRAESFYLHHRAGQDVQLIRWKHDRNTGWTHEKIRGTFIAKPEEAWTLEIDGATQNFTRPEWVAFR